jgi:hypothetical protein
MYTAEEVQQMLRAVQQQQQQPAWGQPQQQQPHFAGAAAAASGQQMPTVQPMFAADPFAQLMQPFISSNPNLAAALGSRAHQGMQQDNAAAAVVDLISGTIRSAMAAFACSTCSSRPKQFVAAQCIQTLREHCHKCTAL